MKAGTRLRDKQGFYVFERRDDVGILRLGKNYLFESTDLPFGNRLLDVIDRISKDNVIEALIIINSPQKIGCEEYIDLCRRSIDNESDHRSIQILCNVFDQFILKLVRLNKIIVHADCGHIIPLFLNLSRAHNCC